MLVCYVCVVCGVCGVVVPVSALVCGLGSGIDLERHLYANEVMLVCPGCVGIVGEGVVLGFGRRVEGDGCYGDGESWVIMGLGWYG